MGHQTTTRFDEMPINLIINLIIQNHFLADDNERENPLHTGGLDLIIVPGLGFTKVCMGIVSWLLS